MILITFEEIIKTQKAKIDGLLKLIQRKDQEIENLKAYNQSNLKLVENSLNNVRKFAFKKKIILILNYLLRNLLVQRYLLSLLKKKLRFIKNSILKKT